MNEYLLVEMHRNKPAIDYSSLHKINEVDCIYHACLLLNPRFGELEIDENATTNDVYDLLTSFLRRREVHAQYTKTNTGVVVEYAYQFDIRPKLIDISPLCDIKSSSPDLYNLLLRCVVVVSRYCQNSAYTYEMDLEWLQWSIDEDEDDESVKESIEMLEGKKTFVDDFLSFLDMDNISALEEICFFGVGSIERSIHSLAELILKHHDSWEMLLKAVVKYGKDADDINSHIPFTEYTGFIFSPLSHAYIDNINSRLQTHFEEDYINDTLVFEGEDVQRLNSFLKSCKTLYKAIDLVETILQEVSNA